MLNVATIISIYQYSRPSESTLNRFRPFRHYKSQLLANQTVEELNISEHTYGYYHTNNKPFDTNFGKNLKGPTVLEPEEY